MCGVLSDELAVTLSRPSESNPRDPRHRLHKYGAVGAASQCRMFMWTTLDVRANTGDMFELFSGTNVHRVKKQFTILFEAVFGFICCISYTQGKLTFEGDATFVRNFVETADSSEVGKAGAVSNGGSDSILFKGQLTMQENDADVSCKGARSATLLTL